MGIETVFANVSCSNLETSLPWYEKLFGKPPTRQPMAGLAEWHFTESAEVQLHESKENAGKSTLTLGVLPMEPEHRRLGELGLNPSAIEQAQDYFLVRLRDPDGNLVVLASAKRASTGCQNVDDSDGTFDRLGIHSLGRSPARG
jgi:hypothetical protein